MLVGMMRNVQVGPDVDALASLVKRVTYKPGWTFGLQMLRRRWGSEGLTLTIGATVPNSFGNEPVDVLHLFPVPPSAWNEREWMRWLLDQVLLVEQHEALEFFRIDGDQPYFPGHAEGQNFYTIERIGTKTREEAHTPSGPWTGGSPQDPAFTV